jgi:hypothetical protein
MTLVSLRRADHADDTVLLRRARRGDRRARRIFGRSNAPRVVELVDLLVAGSGDATRLSADVLAATVAGGVAGDDALVRCALRVLAPATTERGLARLALALTHIDGRSDDEAAELLGRTAAEVVELRALAYADAGTTPTPTPRHDCRGWPLAARRDRLTPPERDAANGHLMLCRPCRTRVNAQRSARDKLLVSGGAVGAVVIADVVAMSLPAGGAFAGGGVAGLVMSKAGAAVVGAAAVAVTMTSAGVAVARHAPDGSAPVTVPQSPHKSGQVSPAAAQGDAGGSPAVTAPPPPTGTSRPRSVTVSAPSSAAPSVGVPAATAPPVSVPVQLPSSLLTSLPSSLPTLPTLLPVLPTRSLPVTVSAPPLPLPTVTTLLGH